jgi:hypothetical protein
MSLSFQILLILSFIVVFSQFGGRLAARNAFVWWLVAGFLIVASVSPQMFDPIVGFLGVKLVSNFVLGTMVLFLFFQLLDLATELSKTTRRQRELVSMIAVDEFKQKRLKALDTEGSNKKKILLILPCYNEEEALHSTIEELQETISQNHDERSPFELDFVFINDGSMDDTPNILSRSCPLNYVSHKTNIGVSGVLLTGFKIASSLEADYVVQCDSDGQHPIHDVPKLVAYAKTENLDLVIGSRFIAGRGQGLQSTTVSRVVGITLIRLLLVWFGKTRVLDPTSGFRVYSRKAQKLLVRNMPDEYPEPETIAILAVHEMKIAEASVTMRPRTKGVSSISGMKTARFMVKVVTALLGLRLRTLMSKKAVV